MLDNVYIYSGITKRLHSNMKRKIFTFKYRPDTSNFFVIVNKLTLKKMQIGSAESEPNWNCPMVYFRF